MAGNGAAPLSHGRGAGSEFLCPPKKILAKVGTDALSNLHFFAFTVIWKCLLYVAIYYSR